MLDKTITITVEEYDQINRALYDAYKMLAESLDTTLMLSQKLTYAQQRWLGREDVAKINTEYEGRD